MIATRKNEALKEIKRNLVNIYEEDPWYGSSITKVLNSVNPKLAFRSPGYDMHSVAELLAHMISWREFAIHRLTGDSQQIPEQEQTFDWKRISSRKKQAWDKLLEAFNSSQKVLVSLLEAHDDFILEKKVENKAYTFHYLLNGVLHHDLYHLGQIVYIHKLLSGKQAPAPDLLNYSYRVFPYESLVRQK